MSQHRTPLEPFLRRGASKKEKTLVEVELSLHIAAVSFSENGVHIKASLFGGPQQTSDTKHKSSKVFPKGRLAYFVTSNIHKFYEARSVLAGSEIATAMLKLETIEIQDNNLETIAKTTAIDAVKGCDIPIIVEDSGLFIKALEGFPGPYSSYVYRTLGTKGILKLMEAIDARDALFHSVVAFNSQRASPKCFSGKVRGKIAMEERGSSGFGFDPIFKPSNSRMTFAEMTTEEKNKHSHRGKALRKFARWYTSEP